MALSPKNDQQLSRSKRAGILVLTVLLLMLMLAWYCLPLWVKPVDHTADRRLQAAWDQFRREHTQTAADDQEQESGYRRGTQAELAYTVTLFAFDPNTASEQDLRRLGLSAGTARTLIKYRSKGGRFYKAEDLRKLYTLKPADYERLAPYVQIAGNASKSYKQQEPDYNNKETVAGSIELNAADAAALIRLKGIGPAFARRIINYRDALGGFVAVEQVREVYGLPDSVYRQCSPLLSADSRLIRLINVNVATEEELARHPYIRKGLASGIIKLRNDLKSFREIGQIRQVPLINEEKYRKIAPYLSTH